MTISPEQKQATDWLLSTTRAVRKRLDLERPVEPEVILECLRLAVQAPTGSNSQGWRWMIVTDEAKRAKLAEFYKEVGRKYMATKGQEEADEQTGRVRSSAAYLVDVIEQVPALVIPCIAGKPANLESAAGFFGSIHPAIWSFCLALRSRGLGSVWTTFHLAHAQETAELLEIPEGFTQAAMLPIAYTKGTDFKPAARGPIEDITFWNTWGESTPA
ncbi:nitroreductase family protein [Cumulibacter soli]|uniref:nitroreductase family protein n=1 Tax=Cumulibacter soli TaxID=2546344 RepID=UPI0010677DF0|nr:nitroreductase family protein [Cumulibacter soli]